MVKEGVFIILLMVYFFIFILFPAILIPSGNYADFNPHAVVDNEPIITPMIQHPVPIQPDGDDQEAIVRPLMLTKKEQKKLRRQNRRAALQEKRDLIRLGVLPPDQPKVKISNLMVKTG